ncbi:hypothetical protein [Paraburkholderia hayleyella]|uniref:hypothetical protein n=1 Tax=Paraburkholderia hayleyella TaxID=2152889 RepID=UPI0012924AF8|nr:hypothetical protein [Paraburkholderia hayleyella]
MNDELLSDIIQIGHLARVRRMNSESRYLFSRLEILYPERIFPHMALALLAIDTADYDDALGRCNRALRLAPDYALAHACKGFALLKMKRNTSAIEAFRIAIRSGDNAAAEMARRFMSLAESSHVHVPGGRKTLAPRALITGMPA